MNTMSCCGGSHYAALANLVGKPVDPPAPVDEHHDSRPFYDLLISSVVDPAGPGGICSAVEMENLLVSSVTLENVQITLVMSAAEAGLSGAEHHRRDHRGHGHHHGGEATTGRDVRANSKG